MTDALWQLGGWTMIHFLWLGTAVALLGGALRFACRRAAPGARYSASLMTLAALAATPIAIATWLTVNADMTPPLQPRALPGGSTTVERELTSTPGQRPGLQKAPPNVVIDLAHTAPLPQQILPLPSPRRGGVGGGVSSADDVAISASTITVATVVAALPWLWLIGAPLTFALLASGLVGSERLRRKCTALTDGPAAAACEQLRQAMRITRRVSIAVCDHIAQPVLIGILRPLILLPASALSGWTPAVLEMVLVHELAHVRRWDNLVNLLQRIIESALFFHPAVWLVSRQVRRDREECCDAVVVSRIERPHDYAALLVAIASSRSRLSARTSLTAASAMADHPLTGRIRRILKLEDEPMWISRRTLGLTIALPILIAYAALYAGAIAGQDSPSPPTDDPSTATASDKAARDDEPTRVPQKFTQSDEPGFRVFKLAHARAGMISINLEEYFEKELKAPGDGPKLRFIWDADSNTIVVQNASAAQLETIGKLVETYDQPKAAAKPREGGASVTKAVAAARDFIDPAVELPRLMHEITRLEDQIAETNKDLVNIEIFRQLALQNARSPADVEKAVAASLDNNPTIATYQQKLFELQEVIQGHSEESKSLDDAKRKQLTKQLQQTEQEMQQHRVATEKAAREQIATMPNEAYRAAIVEHKIRYEAATANLKKYQEELGEASRKLDELFRSNPAGQETDEPIYAIVYPVADLETIDFQRWMQLVSSDERIDLRWFEKNKSLVVSAPKSRHEQINALFRETRDKSGDPGAEEQIGYPTEENPFDNVLTRRTAPPVVEDKPKEKSSADRPLQPGDRIIIQVVGAFPEHPIHGVFSIEPTGTIALGATYGRVDIAGQTLVKAEAAVSKHLATILSDAAVQVTLAATAEAPPADRPLQPYDSVMIEVVGAFPEQPIDNVYTIEPAGTVALGPAYGRVQIAGQSILEAQAGVEKHLETVLTDAKVQLTLHEPAAAESQPPSDGNATYLYDGKPFDEWRTFWKHELNSERRIEAIEALVAFARAGHGREAVEAIFDVAGEYDFKYVDQTPEGKLKERVTQLLTLNSNSRIPAADWLPVLMDRLAKDPKKWRPLAEWLVGGFGLSPDTRLDSTTRKLLLQMATDAKLAPNAFVLSTLYKHSPEGKGDPELAPLIKAALACEDIENALYVLSSVQFASLDVWPEQLDFLFHKDEAVRRRARRTLSHTPFPTRRAVADRLSAILDDPKRADDHADAIRALGVLSRPVEGRFGGNPQHWPNEELNERFTKRFDKITREGPPELVAPALVARGVDSVKNLDAWLKQRGTDESEMYNERLKQARDKIEAEADQVIDRPKPVDPSELDGGGGGFF